MKTNNNKINNKKIILINNVLNNRLLNIKINVNINSFLLIFLIYNNSI